MAIAILFLSMIIAWFLLKGIKAPLAELTRAAEQNSELEVQKKQLNEANRLKSAFLSNMSHEPRTPLNSVIVLSGLLNRRLAKTIPEEEYSYLEVIERNGKNLLALINDILDLSRIEAGREEINLSRFSLRGLTGEIAAMLEPLAREKGIALVNEVAAALPAIASDADKCRHILQNLVANALKFTEEGRVAISARQAGGYIHIKVTDTGIGIAEENLLFIFEEFRQADDSTSRKYGGTGLGLAIAKKYAQLLGGRSRWRAFLAKAPPSPCGCRRRSTCRRLSKRRVAGGLLRPAQASLPPPPARVSASCWSRTTNLPSSR